MKAMLAAAALAAALVPVPGHAATLAQCSGTAPSRGPGMIIPNTALAGSCQFIFPSGGIQTVTLRLTPGVDFVGPLQATIHKLNSPIGMGFKAFFVASVPVLGTQEASFQIDAGEWRFEVLAGHLAPCFIPNTPPPISHCYLTVPAIGNFSGTVTNAA